MYVCMYACMYVCMYVYIYIYIYIFVYSLILGCWVLWVVPGATHVVFEKGNMALQMLHSAFVTVPWLLYVGICFAGFIGFLVDAGCEV